jgi:beta-galactosidase
MVLRDRNHPSIVIYSVGNEIHDDLSYPKGFELYKAQQDKIHEFDSTRPVTMALFRPANSKVYLSGFAEHMEVVGQNYREKELVVAHENNPHWKVIGTENTHVLDQWLALRDKPYMAGQFLWTGIDYLGEEDWPAVTNSQGLFDRAGNWKQQSLQRQSWWSEKPVVHLMRKSDNAGAGVWVNDWTPTDFDTYDNAKLNIYTNCDEVELFLNGKSQGKKPKNANDAPIDWDLSFEKGSIEVIGFNKGKEAVREILKTAGKPAQLKIQLSKSNLKNHWDDVVMAQVQVLDEAGLPCPNADNLIQFNIWGNGQIVGVDNGDINSHESYQGKQRTAYKGKTLVILKATDSKGNIGFTASSNGLVAASTTITIH